MSGSRLGDEQVKDRLLLDLFIQNTRKNLEQEILAACKASIDSAVDKAVSELKPDIERHYDVLRQQTAFVISVRKC